MTSMNNLQEVLNHLVIRDTLLFMYGGKQTLFAMYGINKISIGEPVVILDYSVMQELKYINITKNSDCSYNHFNVPRSNSFV